MTREELQKLHDDVVAARVAFERKEGALADRPHQYMQKLEELDAAYKAAEARFREALNAWRP